MENKFKKNVVLSEDSFLECIDTFRELDNSIDIRMMENKDLLIPHHLQKHYNRICKALDEFGNPIPNWLVTNYLPWSSDPDTIIEPKVYKFHTLEDFLELEPVKEYSDSKGFDRFVTYYDRSISHNITYNLMNFVYAQYKNGKYYVEVGYIAAPSAKYHQGMKDLPESNLRRIYKRKK